MKPTRQQIRVLSRIYFDSPDDLEECLPAMIEYWESIRPKDQAAPEPTPDEIERAEFEAAWMEANNARPIEYDDFAAGWKAAKKGLATP